MMKTSIAIGLVLIVLGGVWIWRCNLPLQDLRNLATGVPCKTWAELDETFPHFARGCRAIGEDPLAPSDTPSEDATRISSRLYRRAGRHALLGIVAIVCGLAVPVGTAIRNRKRRKSEQEHELDSE
jgi:hypothetical protein